MVFPPILGVPNATDHGEHKSHASNNICGVIKMTH